MFHMYFVHGVIDGSVRSAVHFGAPSAYLCDRSLDERSRDVTVLFFAQKISGPVLLGLWINADVPSYDFGTLNGEVFVSG